MIASENRQVAVVELALTLPALVEKLEQIPSFLFSSLLLSSFIHDHNRESISLYIHPLNLSLSPSRPQLFPPNRRFDFSLVSKELASRTRCRWHQLASVRRIGKKK